MGTGRRSFVAECFWPGVRDEDVRALDERVRELLDGAVVYRGSMLIRQDEVVLCEFEGPRAAVQSLAERAGVPFERLLETTRDERKADA
jgi:hypothetical protein